MLKKETDENQISMFKTLKDSLNKNHPLYKITEEINWKIFEKEFRPLYSEKGRPGKPIRLLVGLLILKHLRNISDESVVEQWMENTYFQYFCGMEHYVSQLPCEATELVHFRKRIGESGIELILKESIRINGKDSKDKEVSVDTTVQEKDITYPTDNKLHRKIIEGCKKISKKEGLKLRQSYTTTLKELGRLQRFRNHPKNKSKAKKADSKVKTIAGRLVRELERKLPGNSGYESRIELYKKVLAQKREDKHKIYSLHEPQVCCISKGKEHKKYEFGNKVSIVRTFTGVIVGAMGFRNEYDGNTLPEAMKQVKRLRGKQPKTAVVDRGYRGKSHVEETQILVPSSPKKSQSRYQQDKLRKKHRKRAAIEPIIGHLKADHRLGRNFYKGSFGDNINIMLAAAAFNFKRMMNLWKKAFYALGRFLSLLFNSSVSYIFNSKHTEPFHLNFIRIS